MLRSKRKDGVIIMLQLKLGYAVWGVVAKSLERAARIKWSKVDS